MRVYVVRHGESQTNYNKKWTGWLDASLTDKGKDDAKQAGKLLNTITFDKVFTSDLCRAIDTAKIAIPGCQYETSALVREINVGKLAGTPLNSITQKEREHTNQNGYADYGGEERTEFIERICQFMKKLEALECENIAVFSHGGWVCGMLDIVIGHHVPRKRVCCNNCTIAIFEYTNETWKLHSWINTI